MSSIDTIERPEASAVSASTERRLLRRLPFALLTAAVVATFAPVVRCDFINYDDDIYVTGNQALRAGLSWEGLSWALVRSYTEMLQSHGHDVSVAHWHPLVWLTFLVDYELYGLAPWGYHLTNLLWHLASTLALFAALRRLSGAPWPSFFVAALFGLHPLNVQAVAWVAERKGVVSAFFWMLTLWAYACYVEQPGKRRYGLVALSFFLGLQAKQTLVTLPCVLLLLDYWPLRRWRTFRTNFTTLVIEKLPLFALALVFSLLVVGGHWFGVSKSTSVLPFTLRLENALTTYVAYLGQALLPVNLTLHYPHPLDTLPLWQPVAAGIFLLAASALALVLAERLPYLPVGWFWYLGTLLPLVGVLQQLGSFARADRYAYVPLVGIYIALCWGVADLVRRWQSLRAPASVLGIATLVACALVSRSTLGPWHDSRTLWQHAIAAGYESGLAHNNLGCTLMVDDPRSARTHFEEALRLDPTLDRALGNLWTMLMAKGETDAAAAYCQAALAREPDLALPHRLLGLTRIKQNDLVDAARHLARAVRIDPHDLDAQGNLGWVSFQLGDLAAAERHFQGAAQLDPNHVDARYHLGLILLRRGDRAGAAAHFRAVLKLKPADELAHVNLGIILKDQGDEPGALTHLQEALRLVPDLAVAHHHLGAMLLKRGELAQARTHFEATVRLLPKAAPAYRSLGEVLLKQGDNQAAARCFDKARELDPDSTPSTERP